MEKWQQTDEQNADAYVRAQYISYGDNDPKAEEQIKEAYLAGLSDKREYALACLEKASLSSKVIRTFKATNGEYYHKSDVSFMQGGFSYSIDKESITSKDNLL